MPIRTRPLLAFLAALAMLLLAAAPRSALAAGAGDGFVATLLGKPLTFVEVGYPATEVAARKPWDYAWGERRLDEDLRARCFEAFRRVWGRDPLLRRFAIWGGQPLAVDRNGTGSKGFQPLGKAADPVVRALLAERAR